MTESLVQKIHEICDSYYGPERLENYFNALEEWRQRNQLVDMVINRETSFYAAAERFYDKYGGVRLMYPNTIDNEDLEEVSMLLDVFGGYMLLHTEDLPRLFVNPTATGVYFGIMSGCIGGFAAFAQTSNQDMLNKKYLKLKKENPNMTRREFIFRGAKVGFAFGGLIGFLSQSIKTYRICRYGRGITFG